MAVREIGLEDEIIKKHGILMDTRMIHNIDGSTYSAPFGQKGQV